MNLNELKALLDALACKSGGVASKPVEPQGIAGVAVFMTDGQVVWIGGAPRD